MNQLKKMFFFTIMVASPFAYSLDATAVNTAVATKVDQREQTATHFIIKEIIAVQLSCEDIPQLVTRCLYQPVFNIQKLPKSDPDSRAVYSAALNILGSNSKIRINGVASCVTIEVPSDVCLLIYPGVTCPPPREYKSCRFTSVNSFTILP